MSPGLRSHCLRGIFCVCLETRRRKEVSLPLPLSVGGIFLPALDPVLGLSVGCWFLPGRLPAVDLFQVSLWYIHFYIYNLTQFPAVNVCNYLLCPRSCRPALLAPNTEKSALF